MFEDGWADEMKIAPFRAEQLRRIWKQQEWRETDFEDTSEVSDPQ